MGAVMKELHSDRRTRGFTLVEIMIVVAILGIVLAIAGSTWVKQRQLSQARVCQENLTKIEGAKEQWALEFNKGGTAAPAWSDLVSVDGSGFLRKTPVCPAEGTYTIGTISETPSCTVTAPNDHNQI
jgi:prepilin-type N-terminal cleavage/methylation domain-containing protein